MLSFFRITEVMIILLSLSFLSGEGCALALTWTSTLLRRADRAVIPLLLSLLVSTTSRPRRDFCFSPAEKERGHALRRIESLFLVKKTFPLVFSLVFSQTLNLLLLPPKSFSTSSLPSHKKKSPPSLSTPMVVNGIQGPYSSFSSSSSCLFPPPDG